MNEDFFARRLSELRINKNISARDMSLSLGYSESYINKIENGKAFPSMQVFFYICEFLDISPREFFPEENSILDKDRKLTETKENLELLKDDDLKHISAIIKSLIR
ncbi:MAG: helix-turn-helix transcriptional regulator [Eubacteriales bacterium]